ncbi:MAG: glycosyltransferase family 39 protein [Candidatus Thermoplasmatota archaeon]|nr:glycosyltransferase family 39 protein [Candidatus Thermoplasmatota archaeon]
MGSGASKDLLRRYFPYALILAFSAVLRFYHMMNPLTFPGYSGTLGKNGADEGIFLMTSKLVANGSKMYVDINTHQGPLFTFIFQLLGGDPLAIRFMTVIIGLLGIAGLMMLSRTSASRRVAIISSILLSLNFIFFKVSRQASFDLYCTVLLTFGFLAVIKYYQLQSRSKGEQKQWMAYLSLVIAGILFSMAAMSKLFGVIPILSVGAYMLIEYVRERRKGKVGNEGFLHLITLVVFTALPTLGIMSIYGLGDTFSGMFLSNLDRPTIPLDRRAGTLLKFLAFASIPLILSIVTIVKELKDRTVQLMLVWMVPLSIFILIQSAIWDHYFIMVLPPMCFLAGMGYDLLWRRYSSRDPDRHGGRIDWKGTADGPDLPLVLGRALIASSLIFMIISAGAITGLVMISDKQVEQDVAEDVSSLTDPSSYIISGDPIIGVYADRLQPPEATNIAIVRSPPLLDRDLINITCSYEVVVVVFTYNLANYDLYLDFIQENYEFHKAYTWTGETSEIMDEIEITMDTFSIYVKEDDLDMEQARESFFNENPP